jgi:prepilin-type processing-associated H-X9-DG protein
MQAVYGYATENDGSMPWGWVHDHADPVTWEQAPESNGEYYTWASLLAHYIDPKVSAAIRHSDLVKADKRHIFAGVMLCPEAAQVREHYLSYAMNVVVAIIPHLEMQATGSQPRHGLTRPTKQTLLLKDTAVLWDAAVVHGAEYAGYRPGIDIDDQRIAFGAAVPQWRYYQIKDPFAYVPPGTFSQNRPALLDVSSWRYYNHDPPPQQFGFPHQGNLRFRHRKNTTCNVAFADGSVRQFTGKFKRDKSLQNTNPLNLSHDALRRYFMIKWPSGIHPNPAYPH